MTNSKYWTNRAKILEKALLNQSYNYTKNLERQYKQAIKETEKEIAAWYQKFAKNNNITLAEAKKLLNSEQLAEFKWTVQDYIKYGQQNAISPTWTKQLKNASARVHITRLEALQIQLQQQVESLYAGQEKELTKRLGALYERGYYHTAFDYAKGIGVGIRMGGLSTSAIEKVLARPWTLDGQTFSDRIWANKKALVNTVSTSLTQMIMRGEAPDKAIQTIASKLSVSENQAGRLVMTESAAFANIARRDCFNDLGVEKYVISETLDKETCPLCGQLDGKVYKMSDYAVGVTAPPFHPWCRGTTAPWFADMQGIGERFARDNEGKTFTVPKDMTYEEWAKNAGIPQKFTKGLFTNPPENGKIHIGNIFTSTSPKTAATPKPDSLENKFADFVDNQAGFTDDFRKSLKDAFANGTPAAQKVYIKYMSAGEVIGDTATGKTAFFRSSENKIFLDVNMLRNDARGPAAIYYHEFGHLVDYRARGAGVRVSIDNQAFVKAIHKDFDDMIQDYMKANKCGKIDAYTHFSSELWKDPILTNQVSDLFGGLSNRKCEGAYYHSASYWDDSSLSKEAFAHMFECQFDTKRYAQMQKYFPTALAEFEKMLGGLA